MPKVAYFLLALAGLGSASFLGCRSTEESTSETISGVLRADASGTSKGSLDLQDSHPRKAKTLFGDDTSAYAARIFSRGDEAIVVTPTKFFRIGSDGRVKKCQANIGHLSTRLEDSIVFFRQGTLRSLSLDGRNERELIRLGKQPRVLFADGPRLAWLIEDEVGIDSIQTLSAGSVRSIYTSKKQLSVPVLHRETVYFVEKTAEGWKLGRAPLDGSRVDFGEGRRTRPPAMLAAGPDGIYFYDGLKRGVRKVSFDLLLEQSVNEEVICAPIAVSSRVVCARVGGIIDLPRPGADPRVVSSELGGPIADMIANDSKVFWIADSGVDRMTVGSAFLPEL